MGQYTADYYREGRTLLINKPKGWTSFNVVSKIRGYIRRTYNIKKIKVGHAGTLDPLATGLLIICIGKHTKQITQYADKKKEYTARLTFGYTTPSYDLETEPDFEYSYSHITEDTIRTCLQNFLGEQQQMPPVYSAKNINGKRAYKYARAGQPVEMRTALVTIYEIELLSFEMPNAEIRIVCSPGTYIRSLAYDIGRELNSGATLTALCRTKIGEFSINNAKSIDEAEFFL